MASQNLQSPPFGLAGLVASYADWYHLLALRAWQNSHRTSFVEFKFFSVNRSVRLPTMAAPALPHAVLLAQAVFLPPVQMMRFAVLNCLRLPEPYQTIAAVVRAAGGRALEVEVAAKTQDDSYETFAEVEEDWQQLSPPSPLPGWQTVEGACRQRLTNIQRWQVQLPPEQGFRRQRHILEGQFAGNVRGMLLNHPFLGDGSASGTPLSRDPELSVATGDVSSPRVLPPRRTGYSFIIEATPVECHPRAPKPLTQNDTTYEAPEEEEEVATTSAALERHAAALSQRCADLAAKLSKERQRCSTVSINTEAPLMTPIRIRESSSPKGTPSLEVRGRSTTASSASRLASCLTGESQRPRHSTLSFGQQVWISRSDAASGASLSPVRVLSPMSRSPGPAKSGRVLSQYLFSVPDDGRPLQVTTSMSPLRRAQGRPLPFSTQLSGAISVNHW
eukprot:s825_g11.t1